MAGLIMTDIKNTICKAVLDFLKENGAESDESFVLSLFETPADPSKGDLALPCFRLSRLLHKAPALISKDLESVVSKIPNVGKAESVNGYLNFFFDSSRYTEEVKNMLNDGFSSVTDTGKGKTVVLDFSSPNIAKRFHLGHLGSTVIGNSIRNIYKFLGYKTVAVNHLGDWGTQFGKLIVAYKKWSSEERVRERGIDELVDLYVKFCDLEKNDEKLAAEARAAFAELENGNEDYLSIWRTFKEISLKEYNKTYDLLGVKFDSWNGEAFYTDKMPAVVEELKEKKLLKKDEGAEIVDLSDYNMPPALILKSDGSTLYPTRDIAAAMWRKKEYNFDKCIYVTSAGQSLHFAQWFKVVELMGYDWAKDLVHVPYGTMSINGEKLASRTGNIVLLDDLLEKAIEKCGKIIDEKNSQLKDRDKVARDVGVGAVIFSALANSRIKDKDFVWEEALSFEGNTGPYVQYTYARCASVLRKDSRKADYSDYKPLPDETALIRKMSEFPETVLRAAEEYEPSHISRYAIALCSVFNQFYHNCRIIGAGGSTEDFRLALTECARNVLGKCLDLLGMARTEEI